MNTIQTSNNIVRAGQVVTLSNEWQRFAKHLAKKRIHSNRDNGVIDRKFGSQSAWFTDYQGISGEIAFCQLCNIFPDAEIKPQSGTWDCLLPDGVKVDVKTTKYQTGKLLASLKKADYIWDDLIYALMIGQAPTFRFAGWEWATELIRSENLTILNGRKSYALTQAELHKELPLWEDQEWYSYGYGSGKYKR